MSLSGASRRPGFRRFPYLWGTIISSIVAGVVLVGCGGSSPSSARASLTPSPTPSPTPVPLPTANLSADRVEVLRGQSAVLSWNAPNATALVSSNFGALGLSGTATVTPLATTTYTITVQNSSGQPANGSVVVRVTPVTVTITPSPASMDVSQSFTFIAQIGGAVNTGVTWSVQESDGGSITANGVYTAPAIAGAYHIQATSVADTTKVAIVEVRVRAAGGSITIN